MSGGGEGDSEPRTKANAPCFIYSVDERGKRGKNGFRTITKKDELVRRLKQSNLHRAKKHACGSWGWEETFAGDVPSLT